MNDFEWMQVKKTSHCNQIFAQDTSEPAASRTVSTFNKPLLNYKRQIAGNNLDLKDNIYTDCGESHIIPAEN